mmetsp:Transcript_56414/g.157233  ORF Transcript_56414/g.157233 Transcript_56414/m.157233 type:complete len:241 (+) Transcript_56414:836-1558(+)
MARWRSCKDAELQAPRSCTSAVGNSSSVATSEGILARTTAPALQPLRTAPGRACACAASSRLASGGPPADLPRCTLVEELVHRFSAAFGDMVRRGSAAADFTSAAVFPPTLTVGFMAAGASRRACTACTVSSNCLRSPSSCFSRCAGVTPQACSACAADTAATSSPSKRTFWCNCLARTSTCKRDVCSCLASASSFCRIPQAFCKSISTSRLVSCCCRNFRMRSPSLSAFSLTCFRIASR